ncbi:LLM class F420-dependent oxidoreductase [Ilumatobacter nonamiensis]|uniref:LLM class F420-dependent oxidoreductase n=1 Tax=Ilumatobacter nonamiensis TaxID=467093 RepID=UPI001F4CEDA5|nr:LLM class F420-dependent oxidoreductase [Ilumatobacter nonamiensis]
MNRIEYVAGMDIGVMIFPTDQTMDPVELARESEARGFESLWFPEHSHIPTSRETPWGGNEGAPPLPSFYWRTHDPFVALGACAAVTTKLKLGTGICLVAQRDPIHTAKEVASLDRISGGRMLFGVGYGWNKEEMNHHGTAYGDRRDILRENVLAMKELWTQEEAAFDGEHVRFSSSWSWPKPTQPGGPPVILGGNAGPRTAAHIAEFCDGWMPIGGRHPLERWDLIVDACHAVGRDPESIERGLFGARPDEAKLNELASAGISRAVLGLPQGPRDDVLRALDELAPLVEAMREA